MHMLLIHLLAHFIHLHLFTARLVCLWKIQHQRKINSKSVAEYRKILFRSNGLCFLTAIKEFLFYAILWLFIFVQFCLCYHVVLLALQPRERVRKNVWILWDLLTCCCCLQNKTFKMSFLSEWKYFLFRAARCTFTIKLARDENRKKSSII